MVNRHRAAAAVVSLVCLMGCSGPHGHTVISPSESTTPHLATPASPSHSVSSASAPAAQQFCIVEAPATLNEFFRTGASADLAGVRAASKSGALVREREDFNQTDTPELIWQETPAAAAVSVMKLPPGHGFFFVNMDDRYVAFTVRHAKTLVGPWDLYVWDSQTPQVPPKHLTSSGLKPDGQPFMGMVVPLVANGRVYWAQPLLDGSPDGKQPLYSYTASTGVTKPLIPMAALKFALLGDLIVGAERDDLNSPVRMYAIDSRTNTRTSVPTGLERFAKYLDIVAGDDFVAISTHEVAKIQIWRKGAPDLVSPPSSRGDNLTAHGRYLDYREVENGGDQLVDVVAGKSIHTPETISLHSGYLVDAIRNGPGEARSFAINNLSQLPPFPAC